MAEIALKNVSTGLTVNGRYYSVAELKNATLKIGEDEQGGEGNDGEQGEEYSFRGIVLDGSSTLTVRVNDTNYELPVDENGNFSFTTTEPIVSLSDFLANKSNVESIEFSTDSRYWDTSQLESMNSMFWNCSSLKEINLNSFNTTNLRGMAYLFYGCNNLQNVWMDNTNAPHLVENHDMFNGCSNLTEVYLGSYGDGTTRLSFRLNPTEISFSGPIYNDVVIGTDIPLYSVKNIIGNLSTPYSGSQTIDFNQNVRNQISSDDEIMEMVNEKRNLGWVINL